MAILVSQRGVNEFVGEHDTGKTLAMLQAVYPYTKTVFVDDDQKGSATVQQMLEQGIKFGKYVDMGARRAAIGNTQTPKQLLEEVVFPIVDEITTQRWEVIIWDTWRTVYQALRGYVDRNQNEFKDVVKFQGSSQIIQGLISRVARQTEQTLINRLREKCDLLLISHHIKSWYANNVEIGVIPESSSTFAEVCSMRVWLRKNMESKVPTMLFLKRPNLPRVVKGRLQPVNIVPMKVVPNSTDTSIWDAIKRYEENPMESRKPTPEETPTKEEMNIIRGTLNDEQKQYAMEVLKHTKEDAADMVQKFSGGNGSTKEEKVMGNPGNSFELMTFSMKKYGLDSEQLAEVLGITEDDVIDLEGDEIRKAWKTVQTSMEEEDKPKAPVKAQAKAPVKTGKKK